MMRPYLSEVGFFPDADSLGVYYSHSSLSATLPVAIRGKAGPSGTLQPPRRAQGADRLPQPHPNPDTFPELLPFGQFKPVPGAWGCSC